MPLKIVISRKGFDSGAGGCASPLFEDGSLLSLPIPDSRSQIRYADLCDGGRTAKLANDLSGGKVSAQDGVHLDPDLEAGVLARLPGWRGALGQTGAAASHLESHGVGPGDLFLFFGWFQDVSQDRVGRWLATPKGRSLHALFGWLQVGEVIRLPLGEAHEWSVAPWLAGHPHVGRGPDAGNVVYVARDRLVLPGVGDSGLPGYGRIGKLSPVTRLTADGSRSRSFWRLPHWFMPCEGRPALSYHGAPERWARDGNDVLLKAVARGQEFVLDCARRPEAVDWVAEVVSQGRVRP